jgi:phage shock protein PspC (stress-responsive transcriptional regulator)
MKKIININLSGRVIPIEDTAYESLQRYIESLRRYFAAEEGRDEIINDIESRIAELMNDKIKKGAAAVTEEDVEEIINAMGRIEDFEAVDAAENAGTTAEGTGTFTSTTSQKRFRGRLYRDTNDKILGGVCSGIANYVDLDPTIVRLIFAIFIFGGGLGILAYILLWIILPKQPLENYAGKRFFRNPDDRIIGGVAGGLGAYFNVRPWTIRWIFLAPLLLNVFFGIFNGLFLAFHRDIFPNFFIGSFTGTFLLTYIILWIILPEARTTYEKMEMRGEKVDVNRIRQNVQEEMQNFKTQATQWTAEVKETAQTWTAEAKQFANTRGKTFATEVGQTVRPVGSRVGHILGVIIKAFFIFVAGSIAFGLFVGLIALIFGGGLALWPVKQNILNFMLNNSGQHIVFWGTVIFFFLIP